MEKLRGFFWPRTGFRRSFRYLRLRILRVKATPHAVAAGVAAGAMTAWTPFFGFHTALAVVIAYLLAGNMLAAILGSMLANPLTIPVMSAITWELGNSITGIGASSAGTSRELLSALEGLDFSKIWWPVLFPMAVGAIPAAIVTGILFYTATYRSVSGFQSRRRQMDGRKPADTI